MKEEKLMDNRIAKRSDEAVYEQVLAKVSKLRDEGTLCLPANYSAENAIKSAQLVISEVVDRNKKPALEVCTKVSIAQALLDTVLQGLNPGKKQCYYIVYGTKLTMQRSLYGEEHLAKSVCPDIEDICPEVVYEGDVFRYSKKRGRTVVETHEQKLENMKNPIVAAYCTIVYKDGSEQTTIMTYEEILSSWRMSRQSPFDEGGKLKPGSTHAKFPAEMCKRTVVRRACKPIINSSDDSNLKLSFHRSEDEASDDETNEMIAENSNILDVDFNEPESESGSTSMSVDVSTGEVVNAPSDFDAPPYL